MKLLERIVELLLRGKADQLVQRMKNSPELLKATSDVNESIKNLNDAIAKFEKDKKEFNF